VKEVLEILREILTIVGIILGLYYGNDKIKQYLLQDVLKKKFADLNASNKKVFGITKNIMSKLSEKLEHIKPLTVDELKEIKDTTANLVVEANGASSQVHTLAAYLDHTINNIEPSVKKNNYFEHRLSHEFYNLLFNTCAKINYYANNVIDLPIKAKLEHHSDIKAEYGQFLADDGYTKLKDYKFGLDTAKTSEISLIFYSLVSSSTSQSIFSKRFLSLIQTNRPAIINMYSEKFYFPPILKSKTSEFLDFEYLHLVKFKVQNVKHFGKDISDRMEVDLHFSNISTYFGFVDGMDLEKIITSFTDGYLDTDFPLGKLIKEKKKRADETVYFKCYYDDLNKYFNRYENTLKQKLLSDIQKS